MRVSKSNGFTMVELLAVIVILGLISFFAIPSVSKLIGKSKDENIESHKKTLIMAAESYLQNNKNDLPKDIGQRVLITAEKLREANYLKEDIYNADKKSCMKNSVVKVVKTDTKKYSYTAYIYCEGDTVPDDLKGTEPKISINFTDAAGNPYNISKDNVTSAVVNVEINGGTNSAGEELKLDGYSVIISVQYDDKDQLVEIYNTGSLNANGNKTVIVNRDVTDYIDITRLSHLQATVEAYNSEGGYNKVSFDSRYQDSIPPKCGVTEGEPGEDEWNKNWRTKKISVGCDDGKGSGCVRSKFTKTFTKEAEYDTIQIKDNAGNTTDCKVRVHLDWTEPTLTINAYKRLANGSAGTRVASATAQKGSTTASITKYTNGYGTDSWLNKTNFPDGVYYEVIADDNVKLGSGEWSENAINLKKSDSNVTTVKFQSNKGTKEFTKGDNKGSFSLIEDGYRYGIYVLKDKALNSVKISIIAPLDRQAPVAPTAKLYIKTAKENISESGNLASYNDGTWLNKWVFTKAVGGADTISQFNHYEYTTTGKTTSDTNKNASYRNINEEGTSYIQYRSCDNANNCSGYGTKYTIRLDRTKPACKNTAKIKSSSGKNYSSGTWINNYVYTTASCSETGTDTSKCTATKKVTVSGAAPHQTQAALSDIIIEDNGVSKTTWYVYDNAGNEGKCDTITEKIDTKKPSCSTAKSNRYETSGVTVKITCKDQSDLSKVDSCPSTKTGVKKSATYKVTDNAGNSNTCSVTVSSKVQHSQRTRDDASCTSSKCCGTKTTTYTSSSNHSTACGFGCAGCSYPSCSTPSGCSISSTSESFEMQQNACIRRRTCKYSCKKVTVLSCKNSCCGYTSWSGWGGWIDGGNGCGGNYCQARYRTLYF